MSQDEMVKTIHKYCDFWERCKVHPRKMDVKGHKKWILSLLYARLIEEKTLQSIANTHECTAQRVGQIVGNFLRYDKQYHTIRQIQKGKET